MPVSFHQIPCFAECLAFARKGFLSANMMRDNSPPEATRAKGFRGCPKLAQNIISMRSVPSALNRSRILSLSSSGANAIESLAFFIPSSRKLFHYRLSNRRAASSRAWVSFMDISSRMCVCWRYSFSSFSAASSESSSSPSSASIFS